MSRDVMCPMKPLYFLILLWICACSYRRDGVVSGPDDVKTFRMYSHAVSDIFIITVYSPEKIPGTSQLPVVYLLDANLHFDVFSAALRKYGEAGLLPPVILVGVGYRDFEEMDSLRSRDYTFPQAKTEYEMSISGGALNFYSFLKEELMPLIDSVTGQNKSDNLLAGHSLGGYFVLFALTEDDLHGGHSFNGYIAASPSIHYNDYFLFRRIAQPGRDRHPPTVFIAFGGEEDDGEPGIMPVEQALDSLKLLLGKNKGIHAGGEVYSGLGHMDTPFPCFVNGLGRCLASRRQ